MPRCTIIESNERQCWARDAIALAQSSKCIACTSLVKVLQPQVCVTSNSSKKSLQLPLHQNLCESTHSSVSGSVQHKAWRGTKNIPLETASLRLFVFAKPQLSCLNSALVNCWTFPDWSYLLTDNCTGFEHDGCQDFAICPELIIPAGIRFMSQWMSLVEHVGVDKLGRGRCTW